MGVKELPTEGNDVPWSEAHTGPDFIIFGHDAAKGLQRNAFSLGLDTGCGGYVPGKLTAYILPSKEIVHAVATTSAVDDWRGSPAAALRNPPPPFAPKPLCCFFTQGKCTSRATCKFLHVDDGNVPCHEGATCTILITDAVPRSERQRLASSSGDGERPAP